ncbi:hypothetical protein NLI96_g10859 [Meripilus lineatus]|uniref:Uncharacterized protein n=1 Tax=Meripilus lineatus TaxID=2056292 RepID=A0AAD5YDU0_9APHY|nr:hypothetical protein NLI96_g10859 [Physisporinus lineatus]
MSLITLSVQRDPKPRASQHEQRTSVYEFSRSSPIQNTHQHIDSRQAVEESIMTNASFIYEEDSEFVLHHLSPLPSDWVQPQGDTLVAQIKDAGTISARIQ